jgi:multidrug resistance protein, MATE family
LCSNWDTPNPAKKTFIFTSASLLQAVKFLSELKIIVRHAATVLAGQLATMAFGVTDTIVAGRFAEASLAALSVGAAIYMSVYVGLMGGLQALMPIWSELQGARQFAKIGASFRQALYVCLLAMVLGMAILLYPQAILDWAQVPEDLQPEIRNYLAVLALALPPALLFRLYSSLNQSLGRPSLVTWLQIGALGIKIPLSVWFTFGGLGLPAFGVVGCALATLGVTCGMLGVAFFLMRRQVFYRPYEIWMPMEKPHGPTLLAFARLGIPAGLAILVEVTSFTLMALFIARLGTLAAASHQIAANVATVMYMVPLAIGIASSARVSYWLGAGNKARAQQALGLGFYLALGCGLMLCALLLLTKSHLAALYARSPEVIELTISLLGWAAVFIIFDSLQAVGLFVLRCFRITLAPLLIYGVLLWGLGLLGGYQLAYVGIQGWGPLHIPAAFWMSNTLALFLTAMLFWLMLLLLMRREPKP